MTIFDLVLTFESCLPELSISEHSMLNLSHQYLVIAANILIGLTVTNLVMNLIRFLTI